MDAPNLVLCKLRTCLPITFLIVFWSILCCVKFGILCTTFGVIIHTNANAETLDESDDEGVGGGYYEAKASKKKEKKRQEREAQRQVY